LSRQPTPRKRPPERIPIPFGLDAIRDVQVLCPMNRGAAGARTLNLELQAALNPARSDMPTVERFGFTYRIGDKGMQLENNYDRTRPTAIWASYLASMRRKPS
jgi:ATP-dependent exoDNAse (exonuclease V) alpha subunit